MLQELQHLQRLCLDYERCHQHDEQRSCTLWTSESDSIALPEKSIFCRRGFVFVLSDMIIFFSSVVDSDTGIKANLKS